MFWDNLTAECERQGKYVTPLLKSLGISSGNISSWKKGGNIHSDSLLAIAKSLGVTTDYLLTGERVSQVGAITCADRDEEIMLMMYRSLNDSQRGKCYAYIQGMYDASDKKEKSAV